METELNTFDNYLSLTLPNKVVWTPKIFSKIIEVLIN